ncbi:MAG: hypothetical protein H0X17_13375 [Deltaproteobacteria bacterium]|nr:hypothetical protein [Deltaproteobacteria bacterium]
MRLVIVAPLLAVLSVGGARLARHAASSEALEQTADEPYAPSPAAAPIVTLGYRELAADLLFVRLLGYLGTEHSTAPGIAALAEAVAALDPRYRRIHEIGALAMSSAATGVDRSIHLRAVALLEAGARAFPDNWKLPNLAGQIYLVDLQTTDPAERRAWDERGSLLLESAARKPNAPAEAAMTAASLQTKLGQHERAVTGLRELLLITTDDQARQRIVEQLTQLSTASHDDIAAELLLARKRFEERWKAERPAVPATFYVLLGPPIEPGFDLGELSLGGLEPVSETIERLEPLD